MCEEQEKPGWREMSVIVGGIERPAAGKKIVRRKEYPLPTFFVSHVKRGHVTNGAVGWGAYGGHSPLCHVTNGAVGSKIEMP
jgi:hypothetical protein